jgi:hypothetical protein
MLHAGVLTYSPTQKMGGDIYLRNVGWPYIPEDGTLKWNIILTMEG